MRGEGVEGPAEAGWARTCVCAQAQWRVLGRGLGPEQSGRRQVLTRTAAGVEAPGLACSEHVQPGVLQGQPYGGCLVHPAWGGALGGPRAPPGSPSPSSTLVIPQPGAPSSLPGCTPASARDNPGAPSPCRPSFPERTDPFTERAAVGSRGGGHRRLSVLPKQKKKARDPAPPAKVHLLWGVSTGARVCMCVCLLTLGSSGVCKGMWKGRVHTTQPCSWTWCGVGLLW